MSSEENYLDNLLKTVLEPEAVKAADDAGQPEEVPGGIPETGDELKLEEIEMPGLPGEDFFQESELNIEGLDAAIQSETELEMAGELNIDDLEMDGMDVGMPGLEASDIDLSDIEIPDMDMPDTEIPDIDLSDIEIPDTEIPDMGMSDTDLTEDLGLMGDADGKASIDMDDNLEDVLNMLDDDAELAEINDMLKKSDNNEPIQDDMMDLLNQMADDEAASVNAGIKHMDEDDGGVPLPEIPHSVLNPAPGPDDTVAESEEEDTKKKGKKKASSKKKKKSDAATEAEEAGEAKEPGKLGKFFNMLTEELVPEPTEAELAAEKEAKEAKKQEELTKKEEEKLAKEEAKKAKNEEKEAAKKAKQEAAAQKKKEKDAQKAAKAEAKRAKLAAEGPRKRIPPKKIAVGAVFGASVGGALIVATNILSTQGFLQTARNAYYNEDYKTVYQATYGMELDDTESDGLIKARSEVILRVQRRYDSYLTNLKMGREVEALDALLHGIAAYDDVNADAEKYGVMEEVDRIKTNIFNILDAKYGLDETQARSLMNNEDAMSYTIALSDIISAR